MISHFKETDYNMSDDFEKDNDLLIAAWLEQRAGMQE